MGFPESLDPTSPAGLDSPRLGDDQIRALKQFLADLFGVVVSPTTIAAACGSIASTGKFTITSGTWNGDPISLTSYVTGILGSANGGTGNGFTKFSGPVTSEKTFTLPNASDTIATLGVANTFTGNQTLSLATPSFIMTDTTALAKSLTIAVGSNVANFRESAGASGSLLALDLANNRVGIGTAGPAGPLHVSGASQTIGSLKWNVRIDDTVATAQNEGPGIRFVGNFSGGTIDYGGIGAYKSSVTGSDTGTYLGFHTVTNPASSPTEKMRIDTNGNVGIGTTSPASKLHVVGLSVYANNAAAVAGGLTAGAFYRTGADPDPVCVVH